MSTIDQNDIDGFDATIQSATDILRRRIEELDRARAEQPARLAKARADADVARGWAVLEEPWDSQWTALPGHNRDGDITGMLALPNITAKELFGARLAFDALDCGDDDDQIDAVFTRYFSMLNGDPGMAFLIFSAALRTVAGVVVPQLLEEIEQRGSNFGIRVMLAEARARAWGDRVSKIREIDSESEGKVKPIDGFDIGANAFDPESDPW